MPNIWSKQAYVQGFDCKSISFKKAVNMFEHMDISECIYEGVIEYFYKKTTQEDANRAGKRSNKRGETALYKTCPTMSESAGKRRKRYVDFLKSKSTALHILLMNVRSWGDFVLSTLNLGLLRTMEIIPYQGGKLTGRWKTTALSISCWMRFY